MLEILNLLSALRQVNGRLIVPAAVMLEVAMAAMATLMDAAVTAVLGSVSISAPMLLPALAQHSLVEVSAGHPDGGLEVRSAAAGAGGRTQVHCRGSAARLPPTTATGGPLASLLHPTHTQSPPHPQDLLHKR